MTGYREAFNLLAINLDPIRENNSYTYYIKNWKTDKPHTYIFITPRIKKQILTKEIFILILQLCYYF